MNTIQIELYDLNITERKDDRFGRVGTTKLLNEEDIVNLAVADKPQPSYLKSLFGFAQRCVVKEEL